MFLTRLLFLICLINISAKQLSAQQVKVFSKYNYYTTETEATVIADMSQHSGNRYELSIFNGEKLMAQSSQIKQGLLMVSLPLSDVKPGKTGLKYSINAGVSEIQSGNIEIIRLQPRANEVKIDLLTGGLIADGLPFFPFGFYCRPVGRLPEQEITHGFNLIAPYQSNLPATYAERKAYMDRCAQLGMKVQYSINSLVGSGHNGARGLDMTDEEKMTILKNEVNAFKDHPALLSWYLNDEPDGQSRPVELLEKAYQLVHELDPYHPVSIVFMMPSRFHLFRNAMDIAMTDPYPIPGPVNTVEQFVRQMNHDFSHEKSVWLVPQAFGGQEMWSREPTAKEIRLMTYIGLINGAKGIQYYTHAPGNLNPQSVSAWSTCSDIAVEVAQMNSFLLSAEKQEWLATDDTTVQARTFSSNGDKLVMVINKENKPKSFTTRFSDNENGLPAAASLWFENREISIDDGRIHDMIDAFGTRVYFIKGNDERDSTDIYPGNLTFNPSFEKIVSPGLPTGSNTKKSFNEKTEAGASFFIDSRQKKEGMFSVRMINPADSCGVKIRLLPVVLKAKNSYNISIWAKAKQEQKMPLLRMTVEGAGQEKLFTLTPEWQRYSFIFTPESSFSNAIVSFDLVTAGTAWLDLVQVTPDPVISYAINANKTATVSITTTEKNAVIRYAAAGAKNQEAENKYEQTILVTKPTNLTADLILEGKKIASSQLFIPVNKGLGKRATLQSQYAPQYAGNGAASLTDGLMASTAFRNNKWLGFSGIDFVATIDLEKSMDINSVAANFLCDPNSGIYLPTEYSVYVSNDGKEFRKAGNYKNMEIPVIGEEPHLQTFTINLKKVKARFVRFVANSFGEIPAGYLFKGTMSWIFVDEIMVD